MDKDFAGKARPFRTAERLSCNSHSPRMILLSNKSPFFKHPPAHS